MNWGRKYLWCLSLAFVFFTSFSFAETGETSATQAAPDAQVTIQDQTINGADVDLSGCKTGSGVIKLDLTISNTGDDVLPSTTPLTFYNGNPFTGPATFIKVTTIGSTVNASDSFVLTESIPDQNGEAFDLYIIVNHDGTVASIPLTAYTTTIAESDSLNNSFNMSFPGCLSTTDDVAGALEDFGGFADIGTNDSNPSGAFTTTTIIENGDFGTTNIIFNTTVTMTPQADYFGNDTVTYRTCMVLNPTICDTALLVWVIANTNDAPVALNDTLTTDEDEAFSGDLSVNDSDPDGDALTYQTTTVSGPSNGNVAINSDGTYTYTPNENYFGSDQFTYRVQDPSFSTDEATVIITVTAVNDGVVAVNDTLNINEDENVAGDVSTNDTDVEFDALTYNTTLISGPSLGSVVLSSDGLFTYSPNANVSGTEVFEYRVCDAGIPNGCDTAAVVINIAAVNDTPFANIDVYVVAEDGSLSDDVSTNDSDVEFDNLTYSTTPFVDAANGTVAIAANGTFTYDPDLNFNGLDSFIYLVCDDGSPSRCDTALVQITVTPVNDEPSAVDDAFATNEDITLNGDLSTNDSDVDGDNLTYNTTPVVAPASGSLTIGSDGSFTFVPVSNTSGVITFDYEVCDDGTPSLCSTATATITVNAVNDRPDAVIDTYATDEDEPLSDDVSLNDSDLEGNNLTYTITPVLDVSNGSLALLADGTFTYTPGLNFNGADVFTYQVCDDGTPSECDTASVFITVDPVNDQPSALADAFSTNEDVALNDDLSTNDSDVDGDNLTYTTTPIVAPASGVLVIASNGTFSYNPASNTTGVVTFDVQVCDDGTPSLCDTATATITINPVNDAPDAVIDSYTTDEDMALLDDVSSNDTDLEGNNLTYTTTPVLDVSNGSLSLLADGSFTYTPDLNFNGADKFTYQVCDDGVPVGCDTASVFITVDPVNDQPTASDVAVGTMEDNSLSSSMASNDTDIDGDNLVYTTTPVVAPSSGSLTILTAGTFTYDPVADFNGVVTFDYEVCDDGTPSLCDTATVTITVSAVNDHPDAVIDPFSTNEDTPLTDDVSANDSDLEGDNLSYTTTPITNVSNGALSLLADGSFTYTPDLNFNGSDVFTYQVCDDGTPSQCDTASVFLTVNPVNDAPSPSDDNFATNEDITLNNDLSTNDTDVDGDNLVYNTTPVSSPSSGALTINTDGTFTYIPVADFSGFISFSYEVCDDGTPVLCETANVLISVTPINDAPDAVIDVFATDEDVVLSGNVSANDSDLEGDDLNYSTSLISDVSNGSVSLLPDGNFTYTPDDNFNGSDRFTYQVCDDGTPSECDTASVFLTIDPVNDGPIAGDDAFSLNEGTVVFGNNFTANDSDPEGNNLVYTTTAVRDVANGSLVIDAAGNFIYSPSTNFFGQDTAAYEVCDDGTPSICDTAFIVFTVNGVNDAPDAVIDNFTTDEDEVLSDNVLTNDSDLEGDNLALNTTPIADVSNGVLALLADGTFTYTPSADFNGNDRFTYEVCDDGSPSECDTATVFISVTPVNDKPVALDDAAATTAGVEIIVDVQANDSDVDGDALTTSIISAPVNGIGLLLDDDSISYTPVDPFLSTADTLTYRVCDGNGLCDTASIFFSVPTSELAPMAVNDSVETDEELTVVISVLDNDVDLNVDDVLTLNSIVSAAANGTANPLGNQIIYTPTDDFFGLDSLAYEVCDNGSPSLCDTGWVYMTVTNINDAPMIVDSLGEAIDTLDITFNEDVTFELRLTALDVDGDALDITSIGSGLNISVNGISDGDTTVSIVPDPGYFGSEQLILDVCDDGSPQLCDELQVNLTIVSTNQAPTAVQDASSTLPSTGVTVDVQLNDSDPDGDVLLTSIVSSPSNGVASVENSDSITYLPNGGFDSGSDTLSYQVCDPEGVCDTAILVIFVDPGDLAPQATDDALTLDEDTFDTSFVLANDIDPNGDPLTLTSMVSNAVNGTGLIVGEGIQYTPNPDFFGSDSIAYLVCDNTSPTPLCDTGMLSITVVNVNDAPLITGDTVFVQVDENGAVDVPFEVNDIDGDAVDVTSLVTVPTLGVESGLNSGDTSFTYTPTTNVFGTEVISAVVCDKGTPSLCDTVPVRITINSTNQKPVASNDVANTDPLVAIVIDVQSNDTDPDGDILVTSLVSAPDLGAAVVQNADSISYTPGAGFTLGSDTLVYQVCDAEGACDTAQVVIFVPAGPLAPVAEDDNLSLEEEVTTSVNVVFNDSDPNGDVLTLTALIKNATNGSATISGDSIIYNANPDFFGLDTVMYTVCDPGALCDTASLFVSVTNVNDAPVALDSSGSPTDSLSLTVLENDTATIRLFGSDVDGDGLDITSVLLTSFNGNISGLFDGDTTIQFIPNLGFDGVEIFDVVLCDPGALCDTVVVTINVTPLPNDAPVATNDTAEVLFATAAFLDVQANDVDPNGDALLTTIIDFPTNGVASVVNGDSIQYTASIANGVDTLRYQVCDADNACDTATVFLTISDGTLPPEATNDTLTMDEDNTIAVAVLVNDTDPNGDDLTLAGVGSGPMNGQAIIDGDSLIYTPDAHYFGMDSLTYVVCDVGGLCDTAAVVITLNSVPDAPIVIDELGQPLDSLFLTISPTDNIFIQPNVFEPDGEGVDVVNVLLSTFNGTINGFFDGDTAITYEPNGVFLGEEVIGLVVCDFASPSLCDTLGVRLTITDVENSAPKALDDAVATDSGEAVTINVQANDSDPDGDVLVTSMVESPSMGVTILLNEDSLQYIPNPSFIDGVDTLVYQVCDEGGLCDTASVFVFIASGPTPPVSFDDEVVTNEDVLVTVAVLENDLDPNNDPIFLSSITAQPSNGVASFVNDSLVYTPTTDFNGLDTLTYQVCDITGSCDEASVFVQVDPVNDPPVIRDALLTGIDTIFAEIEPGESFDISPVVTDVDGDTVDIVSFLVTTFNGSISGENDRDTTLTYLADATYEGPEVFEVVACDIGNETPLCDTVVVSLDIEIYVDQPPVATDDFIAIDSLVTSFLDVQENDFDPEEETLLTFIVAVPSNGTAVVLNFDSLQYTPNPGFTSGSDTLDYMVCDPLGVCDTATVVLFMGGDLVPPIALDDELTVPEDVTSALVVLTNDVDPNGDPLTVTAVAIAPLNGAALVENDTLYYTPSENFFGSDALEYVVCDSTGLCDTGRVELTVSPANDAPYFTDNVGLPSDTISLTVPQNETFVFTLNVVEPDGDAVILDTNFLQPRNGTISQFADQDLTVAYTATLDFLGQDTVQFVACDDSPEQLCDTVLVLLDVIQVDSNNAPLANPDFVATDPGLGVTVNVLANDTDPDGDSLTLSLLGTPQNGVSVLSGDESIEYIPTGAFTSGQDTVFYLACDPFGACDTGYLVVFVPNEPLPPVAIDDQYSTLEEVALVVRPMFNDTDPNGDAISLFGILTPPTGGVALQLGDSIRYTPLDDFYGEDFFEYRVCDAGFLCDTGRVYLEVININDAPVISEDTIFVTTRTNFPVDIKIDVTDVDDDTLDISSIVFGPTFGDVFNVTTGDTTLQYRPDTGYFGLDTIRAVVCDGGSPEFCDSVWIIVNVDSAGNTAPNAIDDIVTSNAGETRVFDVQQNDSDPEGDPMFTAIISGPSNGVATVLNGDSLEYTADAGFTAGVDTIFYQLCDAGGLCDTAQVLIFLPDEKLPPVASNVEASLSEDDSVRVAPLESAFDPNGEEVLLSGIVMAPLNGSAQVIGDSIAYQPAANFFGMDSLSYAVCDTTSRCDTAWVMYEVVPVNDQPVAVTDTIEVTNSVPGDFNLVGNDIDVDGDVDLDLMFLLGEPDNGTVILNDSGYVTFTPDVGFIGEDEFSYVLCDSILCDTGTVLVNIVPVNDFFISEGVSPNGDGANDEFVVRGLENYPDNEVTILNRWGNVVFEQTGYNRFDETTVWKGTNENGEPLPDGTYFYVIKLNDSGDTVYTGHVLLSNSGQ